MRKKTTVRSTFCRFIKQKATFLFSLLLAANPVCTAQKSYSKDDKLLNIGIGVNSYYSGGIPIGASFEKGITDEISVGASVDYLSYRYSYDMDYTYKFTALYLGARGSYHFNELLSLDNDKVDLYAGATLGYRRFSWSDGSTSITLTGYYGSGIYLGAFAGGKYYFGKSAGAFAELGAIGSTNVRLGVGFKF